MNEDIAERLSALRITMPPDTARTHLAEIHRELRSPGAPIVRARRRPLRAFATAVAVAVVVLIPTAAIASDGAVPGDVLYPVKRAIEWPWSLVDGDVGPRHRIEELETVIERNEPLEVIEARLSAADEAVAGNRDLSPRLERARSRIRAQYGGHSSAGDGGRRGPGHEGLGGSPVTGSTAGPPVEEAVEEAVDDPLQDAEPDGSSGEPRHSRMRDRATMGATDDRGAGSER